MKCISKLKFGVGYCSNLSHSYCGKASSYNLYDNIDIYLFSFANELNQSFCYCFTTWDLYQRHYIDLEQYNDSLSKYSISFYFENISIVDSRYKWTKDFILSYDDIDFEQKLINLLKRSKRERELIEMEKIDPTILSYRDSFEAGLSNAGAILQLLPYFIEKRGGNNSFTIDEFITECFDEFRFLTKSTAVDLPGVFKKTLERIGKLYQDSFIKTYNKNGIIWTYQGVNDLCNSDYENEEDYL